MSRRPVAIDAERIRAAVVALGADRLVAFPTETVWGLAANAASPSALAELRRCKGRAPEQAISVLVTSASAATSQGFEMSERSRALAAAFWPGPLTLVVPSAARAFSDIANAKGAVGLRCSPHPAAAALVEAAEAAGLGPLTATSLNRSGEAPVPDLAGARAFCAGDTRVELLADPIEDAWGADPSSVLDCSGPTLRLLREGAVSRAALEPFGLT